MSKNQLAQNMRKIWNTTSPRNAHLGISGERTMLIQRYNELVIDKFPVRNKTIIDFGIGGALLGKLLLSKHNIKHYIGFDLSDRSIEKAKENLSKFDNKTLILLEKHVWSFKEYKPDVIVCLACIFHFPTVLYLNNFLSECNISCAEWLVLEIRNRGIGTVCHKTPYTSVESTLMACDTEPKYVMGKLTNYTIVESTNELEAPTKCQILWCKRNA